LTSGSAAKRCSQAMQRTVLPTMASVICKRQPHAGHVTNTGIMTTPGAVGRSPRGRGPRGGRGGRRWASWSYCSRTRPGGGAGTPRQLGQSLPPAAAPGKVRRRRGFSVASSGRVARRHVRGDTPARGGKSSGIVAATNCSNSSCDSGTICQLGGARGASGPRAAATQPQDITRFSKDRRRPSELPGVATIPSIRRAPSAHPARFTPVS
jgi:hypothetical protein